MKIICDWENCKKTGSYKAPIEKDNSKKYRLLCLEHIKIFNKNWNYFENMNDQEIEFFIKSDLTWHKTTKKFGSSEIYIFLSSPKVSTILFSFFKISKAYCTAILLTNSSLENEILNLLSFENSWTEI